MMIYEMLFVLEGKPLPEGKTLEPWKETAIKAVIKGICPNLEAPTSPGIYPPALLGELCGTLAVLRSLLKTTPADPLPEDEKEIATGLDAFVGKTMGTMADKVQQNASPEDLFGLLPSLQTQREFAAGFSGGLNSIVESDGVTLKRESESLILCYLFWTHGEMLRPIEGVTLTHVHKWVNEKTAAPISLANVRKVAGKIGLKLAEPGHPIN